MKRMSHPKKSLCPQQMMTFNYNPSKMRWLRLIMCSGYHWKSRRRDQSMRWTLKRAQIVKINLNWPSIGFIIKSKWRPARMLLRKLQWKVDTYRGKSPRMILTQIVPILISFLLWKDSNLLISLKGLKAIGKSCPSCLRMHLLESISAVTMINLNLS